MPLTNTANSLPCWRNLLMNTYKKAWKPICCSFHAIKALALPDKSKQATPKAPRQCHIYKLSFETTEIRLNPMRAVYNTPHRTFFVALFLTCRWICEILIASKPKRTKTPYSYVCLSQPLPIGAFGMDKDKGKVSTLNWDDTTFHSKISNHLPFLHIKFVWSLSLRVWEPYTCSRQAAPSYLKASVHCLLVCIIFAEDK